MNAWREFKVGWRNLAAATIGLGFGIPCYTPISSLFLRALEQEFGWTRAAAVGAFIALPATALVTPVVGLLIDRIGVRIVAGFSAMALSASFIWLAALSGGLPEYYAATIALFVLGCGTGPVSYTRLVAAQFVAARGRALAIAQFGIAFIAVLLPPISAGLIADFGWRAAYLMMAAITLVGGVSAVTVMKPVTAATPTGRAVEGASVRQSLGDRRFWLLGLSMFLISAASLGLVTQLSFVLIDRGVPDRTAPWLISLLAVSVMMSRLAMGMLLDRKAPQRWAAATIGLAALGNLVLFVGPSQLWANAGGIVLVGFSIGAELDLLSFFCARAFGLRRYSAIYGLLAVFFYIGIAVGGVAYGAVRDETGTYEAALLGGSAMLLLAALALLGLSGGARRAKLPSP